MELPSERGATTAGEGPRRPWRLVLGLVLAFVSGGDRRARRRPRDRVRDARVQRLGPALRTEARRGRAGDDAQLDERRGRRLRSIRVSSSGISTQLEEGVRGLLVDAYLGSVRRADDGDIVYTDLDRGRLQTAIKSASSEATARALELREQAGPPPDDAPREVYLCHDYCELGAVRLADVVDDTPQLPRRPRRRGPGRDHPGRAAPRAAATRARGRRAGSLPRHPRPSSAAPDAGVDGGDGPTGRARAGEWRPRAADPERVRQRSVPGGALQVPLGGPARGPGVLSREPWAAGCARCSC